MITPMSDAVSGSCATARIPLPVRVVRTNESSRNIVEKATTMTSSCRLVKGAPKTLKTVWLSITVGKGRGALPWMFGRRRNRR